MDVEMDLGFSDMNSAFATLVGGPVSEANPSPLGDHSCWGVHLKGEPHGCTPGFQQGKGHFKNKFCPSCQQSIMVPVERVRAMVGADLSSTSNRRSEGFWNEEGEGSYRVVNNTASCVEPPLAIYRTVLSAEVRAGAFRTSSSCP